MIICLEEGVGHDGRGERRAEDELDCGAAFLSGPCYLRFLKATGVLTSYPGSCSR